MMVTSDEGQKYNRFPEKHTVEYNQLWTRNFMYATCTLACGNADVLVIPDNCNEETSSLKVRLMTLFLELVALSQPCSRPKAGALLLD